VRRDRAWRAARRDPADRGRLPAAGRGRPGRRGAGQQPAPAVRRRHHGTAGRRAASWDPASRGRVSRGPASQRDEEPAMTQSRPAAGPRPVRAPRGTELSCQGWPQEAAMRMLMNNLDPEVAEHPDQLIVYGGSGRAARSWDAYDAIVASLQNLAGDETLLV